MFGWVIRLGMCWGKTIGFLSCSQDYSVLINENLKTWFSDKTFKIKDQHKKL